MEQQQTEQRRVPGTPFPKGVSGNLSGRRAQLERAAREERERQVEAMRLIEALQEEPTAAEVALVEQASYLIIQSRRLRAGGRPATECSRLLTRIMALVFGRDGRVRRETVSQQPAHRSPTTLEQTARIARPVALMAGSGIGPTGGETRAGDVPLWPHGPSDGDGGSA
jgi:hypothetical protein